MADYQLTATDQIIIRTADHAYIPNDEGNRDWVQYQAWLADGGVPDPYVAPEMSPPEPTAEQAIMFDHENRIRAFEGEPPLTMADFLSKMAPK